MNFVEPIWQVLVGFLSQSDLPSLLQNFSLAVLTVLIPIAIALFQTVLSQKKDENEFFDVDRHVVIDSVLKVHSLVVAVFLCFIPTLLWGFIPSDFKIFALLLWMQGMLAMILVLNSNLEWVKGGSTTMRLDYLSNLKPKNKNLVMVWELLWKVGESLKTYERFYLDSFTDLLNGVFQKEKYKLAENLIDVFLIHIHKRNPLALIAMGDFLTSLLNWHKQSWIRSHQLIGEDDIRQWSDIDELNRKINEIIRETLIMTIRQGHASSFFPKYKKHLEENISLTIKAKEGDKGSFSYIRAMIEHLTNTLLDRSTGYDELLKVWRQDFPDDWRITEESLKGDKELIVLQVTEQYVRWVQEQASRGNENHYVDNVTIDLVPEVEPVTWLRLLTFCLTTVGRQRVISMVKKEWDLGQLIRVEAWAGNIPTNEEVEIHTESQVRKTFDLLQAIPFFAQTFSKGNLSVFINDLEDYMPATADEGRNKEWLLTTFKKMLDHLNKKDPLPID